MSAEHTDPSEHETGQPRASGGWVLSLGFWGCLLAATVLFATVSLAPRLVVLNDLEAEYATRQGRLLTLGDELEQLARVREGLANDPDFAASVTRHEVGGTSPVERSVPVGPELAHDARSRPAGPIDVEHVDPWYLPVLRSLSDSPARRLAWSLVASGLLLFGFTFLHENAGAYALFDAIYAPVRAVGGRYFRARPHD